MAFQGLGKAPFCPTPSTVKEAYGKIVTEPAPCTAHVIGAEFTRLSVGQTATIAVAFGFENTRRLRALSGPKICTELVPTVIGYA